MMSFGTDSELTMYLDPGEAPVPCERCGRPITDGDTFGIVPLGFEDIPPEFAGEVEAMMSISFVCAPCSQPSDGAPPPPEVTPGG